MSPWPWSRRTDSTDPPPKEPYVTAAPDVGQPPLDIRSTAACPVAALCELCADTSEDLRVTVFTSGGLGACVTACATCVNKPLPDGLTMNMFARAGEHAHHLGIPAPLVEAIGSVRAGAALEGTASIPIGPFDQPPDVLGWVLSGGGHTDVDPARLMKWLRDALDECAITTGPGEENALAYVVEGGPEVVQVIAGLSRRSRPTGEAAVPASFTPVGAQERVLERLRAQAEERARLLAKPEPTDTRAVQTLDMAPATDLAFAEALTALLAEDRVDDIEARLERRRAAREARDADQ